MFDLFQADASTQELESMETPVEPEVVAEESQKELTELDKYWKAVKDNPTDFTGWTYLLQYVEQEVVLYNQLYLTA